MRSARSWSSLSLRFRPDTDRKCRRASVLAGCRSRACPASSTALFTGPPSSGTRIRQVPTASWIPRDAPEPGLLFASADHAGAAPRSSGPPTKRPESPLRRAQPVRSSPAAASRRVGGALSATGSFPGEQTAVRQDGSGTDGCRDLGLRTGGNHHGFLVAPGLGTLPGVGEQVIPGERRARLSPVRRSGN